jgi:ribonuclease Z
MNYEINDLTELAYDGGEALTTTPMVGESPAEPGPSDVVGGGPVGEGQIRVTILGSGDPFVNRAQGSASVLIEVGNEQDDFFFFDLGSGSLANFNGLHLPVTATTKSS